MKGKFWVTIVCLLLVLTLGGYLGRGTLLFGGAVLRGGTADGALRELPISRPQGQAPTAGRIDLNTATEETLQELPGVGAVLARNIVALRQKLGGFTDLSQLLQAEGLGQGLYDKIKDLVCIGEN